MTDSERGPALNMEANPPEPGAQRVMGDGREGDATVGPVLRWNEMTLTGVRFSEPCDCLALCPRAYRCRHRGVPLLDRAERLQAFLARQTPPIVLTDGQALGAVRAVEGG